MNNQQNPNQKENYLDRLRRVGVEKTYGVLMICTLLSLASLALIPRNSIFTAVPFLITFALFGLSGLILIFFKEMPGLFKPIKGTSVVITGYTFVITSLISIIIILYSLLTN